MALESVKELFDFIQSSPSCYHVIDTIKRTLNAEGFIELSEQEEWNLEEGKNYYVTRNLSSIAAFKVPSKDFKSFQIIASHSDSPSFKIKSNPEKAVDDKYVVLNTERYGGMIYSTWLDRPLSVAGRVMVKTEKGIETRLVNVDRDLLVIPNLCIHLDKEGNKNKNYNPQLHLLPMYSGADGKGSFDKIIAEACGEKAEDIISSDLFLYNRMAPSIWGANNEYFSCSKIDDLACVFTSLKAFTAGSHKESVSVYAVFDNEEVGSGTKQGADSTFLEDILYRINMGLGRNKEKLYTAVASSFLLSADNDHALHPNYADMADPTNHVIMNEGIVLKHSARQDYTTDAVSCALFETICKGVDVPCQKLVNRSDMSGGSTLGNISNAHVSVNAADIGLGQLAMHSSYETAGVADVDYMIKGMTAFYNSAIIAVKDGSYEIH